MKLFNKIQRYAALLGLVALTAACDNDGDMIYLSSAGSGDMIATESDVVLGQEVKSQIVLSLSWTNATLSVSDPSMSAPNVLSTWIQVSDKSDFTSNVTESLEKSQSKAYTGAELNTVAKNLGITPDVAVPLYFRIRSSVGSNMESTYGNTVTVKVTSYTIDMTKGFILDSKQADTGYKLVATADGVYAGFVGASGWYNFFLQEGDGTTWGNEGVVGTPFTLSSEEDASKRWNFWYPGVTGCYYTIVNTAEKNWSALLLPTLTVSGGVDAEMTFDRPNVKWTTTFNASSAGSIKIRLQTTGKLYNVNTGTDDAAAISTPVAFAPAGTGITMAVNAADITVNVPQAGEVTLVVDLSNPTDWKCSVVTGSAGPVVINPFLYLPGIDDGISGEWTFDNVLSLYNEDDLAYAGVVNVNSLWGYSINVEDGNWDDKYGTSSSDPLSGELEHGGGNLPTPEAGLYLIDVRLKDGTYSLTLLGDAIYVVGLHDVWEFDVPLAATATPGVFEGEVTINSASPWGFQLHVDDSWNHKFGGSNGSLTYNGSNFTDDASLAPGTYVMTVDLVHLTYTFK